MRGVLGLSRFEVAIRGRFINPQQIVFWRCCAEDEGYYVNDENNDFLLLSIGLCVATLRFLSS